MAIYHLTTKVFSRGKGQSAIAAAAYRSGERLFDEVTGEQKAYRSGSDRILFAGLFVPPQAPDWSRDRNRFWNHAEQAEVRRDGRLAREIEVALPHELTDQQRQYLVADFVREAFVRKGYAADVAIHAPYRDSDERNYHAHILISERQLGAEGFAARKNPAMNSREQLAAWREQWARLANRHLERHGHEARIDHRSLEAQGIELEPTVHLGYAAIELVKRGAQSDRADEFVGILTRNGIRMELQAADKDLARLALIEDPYGRQVSDDGSPRSSRRTRAMIEEPGEELLRKQAAREAELLQELRENETRAQHYRLQRQAEADEAIKKRVEQQEAEDRRALEGDISQASARYAIALGQAYDVRDPYASLARAAMVESGLFHKNQEKMREQIAKEADPDKRRIIALRQKIEGAEYMAITSDRLAGIGVAITGQRENPQAALDRSKAEQYRELAAELRQERSSLVEATLHRDKEAQPHAVGAKQADRGGVRQGAGQQRPAESPAVPSPERGPAQPKEARPAERQAAPASAARAAPAPESQPPQAAVPRQAEAEPTRKVASAVRQPERPAEVRPAVRSVRDSATPPRDQPAPATARLSTTWNEQEAPLAPKQQAPQAPAPQNESKPAEREPPRPVPVTAQRTQAFEPEPFREPMSLEQAPHTPAPEPQQRVEASHAFGQYMPLPQTRVTRPAEGHSGDPPPAVRTSEPALWVQPEPARQGLQVKDSESGRLVPLQDYARAMPPPVEPDRRPPDMRAILNDPVARRAHNIAKLEEMRTTENAEKALGRIEKDMTSGKPVESRDLKALNREQWESVRKHGDEGLRQVVKEASQRAKGRDDGGRERER